MAAASNIVINDGAATPVAHTFVPAITTADNSVFEDKAAGIYIGYNRIRMMLERPSTQNTGKPRQANGNLRLKVVIETPKLETLSNSTVTGISPAPTIAYVMKAEVIFTLPERSALQDRKDLMALLKNFLATAVGQTAIESFELPY